MSPRGVTAGVALLALAGCTMVRGPPRDGECRANLRTILSGEVAFFEVHRRYSVHPAEVGFAPAPGNRYLYLFDREGPVSLRDGSSASPPPGVVVGVGPDTRRRGVTAAWLLERFPAEVREQLGVQGECPDCSIVIGCVGNLDDDEAVDVWTISSADRELDGVKAPRGSPFRHRGDKLDQ